jgi:hypothetical protein
MHTVFGLLRPKLVLLTTPNREFNIVFGNEDQNKFRHWDHKFEWTRSEFESWCCSEILAKYSDFELVFFDGLGDAPEQFADRVGKCTQMALFRRKNAFTEHNSLTQEKKLVEFFSY